MTDGSSFRMSQGFDVLPPKPGKAYPILCEEWEFLKDKVRALSDRSTVYHTIGSLLLGSALTTFISILTGVYSSLTPQETQIKLVMAWAIMSVTLICGALCMFFFFQQRKIKAIQASEVITQMELIEKRYQADT